MWLRFGRRWLPKHSLAVLMFEWLHSAFRARGLRFLSRHRPVGADVMPMSLEA